MDSGMQDRLKAALAENKKKDHEFAEQKKADEAEVARAAARKSGAAEQWPTFIELVSRSATIINNDITNQDFLLDVKEVPPSSNFLKCVEVKLLKSHVEIGPRILFHLEPRGFVRPVLLEVSSGTLEPFDFFSATPEKVERLLLALFEHYVRGRTYRNKK